MMEQSGRIRVQAGNVTLIVQHELWDGNIKTIRTKRSGLG